MVFWWLPANDPILREQHGVKELILNPVPVSRGLLIETRLLLDMTSRELHSQQFCEEKQLPISLKYLLFQE